MALGWNPGPFGASASQGLTDGMGMAPVGYYVYSWGVGSPALPVLSSPPIVAMFPSRPVAALRRCSPSVVPRRWVCTHKQLSSVLARHRSVADAHLAAYRALLVATRQRLDALAAADHDGDLARAKYELHVAENGWTIERDRDALERRVEQIQRRVAALGSVNAADDTADRADAALDAESLMVPEEVRNQVEHVELASRVLQEDLDRAQATIRAALDLADKAVGVAATAAAAGDPRHDTRASRTIPTLLTQLHGKEVANAAALVDTLERHGDAAIDLPTVKREEVASFGSASFAESLAEAVEADATAAAREKHQRIAGWEPEVAWAVNAMAEEMQDGAVSMHEEVAKPGVEGLKKGEESVVRGA